MSEANPIVRAYNEFDGTKVKTAIIIREIEIVEKINNNEPSKSLRENKPRERWPRTSPAFLKNRNSRNSVRRT